MRTFASVVRRKGLLRNLKEVLWRPGALHLDSRSFHGFLTTSHYLRNLSSIPKDVPIDTSFALSQALPYGGPDRP